MTEKYYIRRVYQMSASISKTDIYQWKTIKEEGEETILPCLEIPSAWCMSGMCSEPCCKILEIGC